MDYTTVAVALIAAVGGTLGVEVVRAIASHARSDAEARSEEVRSELSLSAEGREVVRLVRAELGGELESQRKRYEDEIARVLSAKAECERRVADLQGEVDQLRARVARLERESRAGAEAGSGRGGAGLPPGSKSRTTGSLQNAP